MSLTAAWSYCARSWPPRLRYEDPARETEFLVFAHRSRWAFAFLAIVLVIQVVRFPLVIATSNENELVDETWTVGRFLCTLVAVLFAVVAVVRLLQDSPRFPACLHRLRDPGTLALACEWLQVPMIAATVINSRVACPFEKLTFELADGGAFTARALGFFDLPLTSLLAVDAPRFFTIAPVLLLTVVAEVARYLQEAEATQRARIAAASLAVFEALVTLGLVRVWELVRRRDFEARHATAARAQHVAALVIEADSGTRRHAALPTGNDDDCSSGGATANGSVSQQLSSNDSDHRAKSATSATSTDKVLSDACAVVARVVAHGTAAESNLEHQLRLAACLVGAGVTAAAAFGSPSDAMHPPHGLRLVAVLEPTEMPPAVRAAAFARALHRAFSAAVARHELDGFDDSDGPPTLAIGVHAGAVEVHQPGPHDHSATLAVDGPAVSLASRLCDAAPEDATFVSGPTQALIADDYASRRVNTMLVGDERVAQWILGQPWSEAALRAERRGRRTDPLLQAAADATPDPRSGTREDSANETPAAIVDPAATRVVDDSCAVAAGSVAVAPPEFRYTCWGFRFDDPDLEDEFRATEHNDAGRFAPAATNALVLLFLLPWFFFGEHGAAAAGATAWSAFAAAAALVAIGAGLSWRSPPGQGRLVALTLLVTVPFELLVMLFSLSLDGPSNPATMYATFFLSFAHIAAYHWLPEVLPAVILLTVIMVVGTISFLHVSSTVSDSTPAAAALQRVALLLIEVLTAASVRLRNRHRFAAVAAARISLERWAAMRADLERRLSLVMPAATARRLCELPETTESAGSSQRTASSVSTARGTSTSSLKTARRHTDDDNDGAGDGERSVELAELHRPADDPQSGRHYVTAVNDVSGGMARFESSPNSQSESPRDETRHGIVVALRLDVAHRGTRVAGELLPLSDFQFKRSQSLLANRAAALGFLARELAAFGPFPFTSGAALGVWVNAGTTGSAAAQDAATEVRRLIEELRDAARCAGLEVHAAVETGPVAGSLIGGTMATTQRQYVVVGGAAEEALVAVAHR